jgi:hypothetical protein
MREKEKGLAELLEKTEEELKMIKSEVFQLFVSHSMATIQSLNNYNSNRILLNFRIPAQYQTSRMSTVR